MLGWVGLTGYACACHRRGKEASTSKTYRVVIALLAALALGACNGTAAPDPQTPTTAAPTTSTTTTEPTSPTSEPVTSTPPTEAFGF